MQGSPWSLIPSALVARLHFSAYPGMLPSLRLSPRRVVTASAVLLAAFGASCSDGPGGTGPDRTGVTVAYVARSLGADVPSDVQQVRFVLRSAAGDSITGAADGNAAAPNGHMAFELPKGWKTAPVTVVAAALTSAGETRWSGQSTATISNGNEIGLTFYPGPPENLGISELTIAPPSGAPSSLEVGDTLWLSVTVRGTDGIVHVYWGSADSSVVRPLADGRIVARGTGTTTIIAAAGPHSDTISVRVTERASAIRIQPDSATALSIGDTIAYSVTSYAANGNAVETPALQWESGDTTVARSLGGGRFVAKAAGRITVRARVGFRPDINTSAVLRVVPTPATLTITPAGTVLHAIGDTVRLSAAAYDARSHLLPGAAVRWASSAASVIAIDSTGLATARSAGTAMITASSGASSVTVPIEVAPTAATVTVDPRAATLRVNDTTRLAASARDRNGNAVATAVSWAARDPNVASVTSDGVVRGVHAGVVAVVASVGSISDSAVITVQAALPSVARLAAAGGDGQTGIAGDTLATALSARALSPSGAGVAGQSIAWRVVSGNGSLTRASATTDSSGVASTRWVLGSGLGTQEVEASLPGASGVTPIRLSATATAGGALSVVIEPHDTTLTAIGDTVAFRISAADRLGHAVGWTSTIATPALLTRIDSLRASARGAGQAWVRVTSGNRLDSALVRVIQQAVTVVIGGAPGSYVVGDTVHLSATAADRRGAAIASAAVTWSSSDATVVSVGTDGACVALRAGDAVITATSGTATASVTLHVTPATPAAVEFVDGQAQTGVAGSALGAHPTVRVRDTRGRVVVGATVTWTATADGSATPASSVTDSLGTARTTWSLRTTAGADSLAVVVTPLTPIYFTATAQAGAVANLAISASVDSLGALGDTANWSVTARDAHGNVITGASPTWSSSTPSVATVDAAGHVIAVGNGTATITVAAGSATASRALRVRQNVVTVAISPTTVTAIAGDTVRLAATARDTRAVTVSDATVTWTSSDSSALEPIAAGAFLARSASHVTVRAVSGLAVANAAVDVTAGAAAVLESVATPAAGIVGDPFADSAGVRALNAHGVPVPGVSVTWTHTSSAAVSAPSALTSPAGIAKVLWTARTTPGPDTLVATVVGLAPIRFVVAVAAGAPSSIQLTVPNDTLRAIGDTVHLSGTVRDRFGNVLAGTRVVWTSGTTSVATVDSTGAVIGVAPGTTSVTATSGTATANRAIVVQPAVAQVQVTPSNPSAILGDTLHFSATLRDARGHVVAGATPSWNSSAPGVVSIGADGVAVAQSTGPATITASAGGVTANSVVSVSGGSAAAIELVQGNTQTAAAGSVVADSPTVRVRNAHGLALAGVTVTWAASRTGATSPGTSVTDASGLARTGWRLSSAVGTDTLTAIAGGLAPVVFTASAVPGAVSSIAVSLTRDSLGAFGDSAVATAVARDGNGNVIPGPTFTWSSSAPGTASVNAGGVVVAAGNGSASIIATIGSVNGSAAVRVAQAASSIVLSPLSPSIVAGDSVQLAATVHDARGNVIAGAAVSWLSSDPTVLTVSGGLARGVKPGSASVTAASGAATSNTSVGVTAGAPAAVTIAAGNSQSGAVAQRLADSLVVLVQDAHGFPVPGATVTWSASADGTASPGTAATDATGHAATTWTLRRTAGPDTLTATVAGAPAVRFVATATGGSAAVIRLSTHSVRLTTVGDSAFFSVHYEDAFGNPVTGPAYSVAKSPSSFVDVSTVGTDQWKITARSSWDGRVWVSAGSFADTARVNVDQVITHYAFLTTGGALTGDTMYANAIGDTAWIVVEPMDSANADRAGSLATALTSMTGVVTTAAQIGTTIGCYHTGGCAVTKLGYRADGVGTVAFEVYSVFTHTATDTAYVVVRQVPASVTVAAAGPIVAGDSVALSATVRDSRSNVIPAAAVTWSSSDPTTATVTSNGVLHAVQPGTVTITAASGSATTTTTVGVNAGAPAGLAKTGGDAQTGTVGGALTDSVAVHVTDAHGFAVPGATVTWAPSADGAVGAPTSTTNASGIAKAAWTLRRTSGPDSLRVSVGGVPAVVFTATANAGALARIVLSADTLRFATVLDTIALTATGKDAYGNTLATGALTWSSSNPQAMEVLPDGRVVGWHEPFTPAKIIANAGGLADTAFAVYRPVVTRVRFVTGLGSTTDADSVVATSLGDTVVVYARSSDARGYDAYGYEPGVGVIDAGVSTVSSGATGDATTRIYTITGHARITGTTVGQFRVFAVRGSLRDTMTVVYRQAAASVQITPGAPTIVASDSVSLSATVRDARNYVIAGAPVAWSSSDETTATVASDGVVHGLKPGTVSVTATSGGVSSSVGVTITAGAASAVSKTSGDAQTGAAGAAVTDSLSVRVTDAHGFVVPGATVSWAPTADGGASPATSVTDASGVAKTRWNLRHTAGADSLKASVGALPAVVFTATATAGPATRVDITESTFAPTAYRDSLQLHVHAYDAFGNETALPALSWSEHSWDGSATTNLRLSPDLRLSSVATGGDWYEVVTGAGSRDSVRVRPNVLPVATLLSDAGRSVRVDTLVLTAIGDSATLYSVLRDSTGVGLPATVTFQFAPTGVASAFVKQSSGWSLYGLPDWWSWNRVVAQAAGTTKLVVRQMLNGTLSDSITVVVRQTPASLTVTPTSAAVVAGDSTLIVAVVKDSRNQPIVGGHVTWSSSNPGAATVDSAGRVHGVAPGTTTITATSGSANASATVTVTAGTPANAVLFGGSGQTAVVGLPVTDSAAVRVTDANGFGVPGVTVVWTATNGSAASPSSSPTDASGYARTHWTLGQVAGTDSLTALVSGLPAVVFTATAQPAGPKTIVVSAASDTMFSIGDTIALTAVARDTFNNLIPGASFSWSSGTPAAITVDATGHAVATGAGPSVITATSGTAAGTRTLVVAQRPASIAVSPTTQTLPIADTLQTAATVKDARNQVIVSPSITWSSSDAGVATVNTSGMVVSLAAGSTTITATAGSFSATTVVTVVPDAPIGLDAQTISASPTMNTVCALRSTGFPVCWGYNASGQLGDNSTTSRSVPVAVSGGLTFVSITNGSIHTCGLTAAGAAYCWGNGSNGRVGNGLSGGPYKTPQAVVGGLTFASIRATDNTTCGLTTGHRIYCWGQNGANQVGDSTSTDRLAPVPVYGRVRFKHLGGGVYQSCAISLDDKAYCWGVNTYGETGIGSYGSTNVRIPTPVTGGKSYDQIYGAQYYTCAIETGTGSLWCWGNNNNGVFGSGATGVYNPNPVASGSGLHFTSLATGNNYEICGLIAGGVPYCWGYNQDYVVLGKPRSYSYNTPQALPGGATYSALIAGKQVACGVTSGRDVYCWGNGQWGALGHGNGSTTGDPTPTPALVAGGTDFAVLGPATSMTVTPSASTFANAGDSTAISVTVQNGSGQVIPNTQFTFTAPDTTLLAFSGGNVWAWGGATATLASGGATGTFAATVTTPVTVTERLGTSAMVSCALTAVGRPYCWGSGTTLGLASGSPAPQAHRAFTAVATGNDHVCGIDANSDAWCWGNNSKGQLGNSSTANSLAEVPVSGGVKFAKIYAAGNITCGLSAAGAAYCWGDGTYGLGDGLTAAAVTAPVAVSGGLTFSRLSVSPTSSQHICGLTTTGDVYCWGYAGNWAIGDSVSVTRRLTPAMARMPEPAVDVAAGYSHTCAAGQSGAVYCWGANMSGWYNVGQQATGNYPVPTVVAGITGIVELATQDYTTCGRNAAGSAWCFGANLNGAFGNGSSSPMYTYTPTAMVGGFTLTHLGAHSSCAVASTGGIVCWGPPWMGTTPAKQAFPFNQ